MSWTDLVSMDKCPFVVYEDACFSDNDWVKVEIKVVNWRKHRFGKHDKSTEAEQADKV